MFGDGQSPQEQRTMGKTIMGVLEILIGVIMYALLNSFIGSMNTSGMSSTNILILQFMPTFVLIGLLAAGAVTLFSEVRGM